jgi:DNA adenine methylase
MKPLYMWAGGKNKMIPKYQESPGIPMSGYDTYVEPFFGGGAMMIHIAQNNPTVKKFILNDINPEIVGLYRAIKTDVAAFMTHCDALCDRYMPMTKEQRKTYYYEVRKEYTTDYAKWSPVQESATLYFLMKTAFNGIFQSTKEAQGRFCTPSGLLNQKTEVYDKQNVLDWHAFLQRVDIYSGEWSECCDKIQGRALYFFDPPYRDSFTQYGQVFSDQKHQDVIQFGQAAAREGHLVMLCNRLADDTFIQDNQGDLQLNTYSITYTAGRRATQVDQNDATKTVRSAKAATEVLLHNITKNPVAD